MSFYREATIDDFQEQIQKFAFIPASIKEIIGNDRQVRPRTVTMYRELACRGLVECKRHCEEYLSFVKAFEDFNCGITVFTEY